MKVWVTRDRDGCCIWNDKAVLRRDLDFGCFEDVDMKGDRCTSDMLPMWFKEFFGFTPRKGSCKQYELTLKEIK